MPLDIRVVSIRDFLRTNLSGSLDFLASKALLTDISKSCAESGIKHVLIDVRDVTATDIQAADVYSLAMHMLTAGFDRRHRIAIINEPKDDVDRSKLVEELASENGLEVAAFREFEAALRWLNSGML